MRAPKARAASTNVGSLSSVNAALIRRAIAARFVTLFYAVLSPDGQLTFCNAGHNPPFLVGRTGVRRLETGGMPLVLFEGTPLEEETVTMEPGDFVVTFSDGVSEAFNPAGEEFEDARILRAAYAYQSVTDWHERRAVVA